MGGQAQMGNTQLWKAPFTQLQVPAAWDEHQTFTQQDQVFLWGDWCPWEFGAFGAHSNLHISNRSVPEPFWDL